MKAMNSILFFSFLLFCGMLVAAQNWIADIEMQFKINAPQGITQNQIRDGSDKVLSILSPDQHAIIRVWAMKATNQFARELFQ